MTSTLSTVGRNSEPEGGRASQWVKQVAGDLQVSTASKPSEVTSQTNSRCRQLLERACESLAGGDSSTMRVLPYHLPLVAERGEGSRLWDADGNEFIDFNMAYGPLILGHCPARVIE